MATIRIIPFSPGRRATDEARHPGMGSSDAVAFREGAYYLLLAVAGGAGCELVVGGRTVVPTVFSEDGTLREASLGVDGTYAVALDDLPGEYSFATLFSQRLALEVRLTRDGEAVASDEGRLEVYDVAQMGSLYERIVERLIKPDTQRQAPGLSHAYHPWFPVLAIGAHKAELYTRALVGDIVHKRRNLADPGWLVRVGSYLEFLTALGIVEAVRDDAGDLLTPEERDAFETSPAFAELRPRVNAEGWRDVWALRQIITRGLPRSGPVSAMNLLAKRRATLQFLHVHHEDLKHAIELAGPNLDHAQETWHRVFRDAERAVLRQTPDAFPELDDLPGEVRKFVLWHRQGQLGLTRALRVPGQLGKLLGDQDGLFGSACNQYRDSMNDVADWARARELMDHTGEEAVPRAVSLFEAHLNQPSRVALLQQRDGYDAGTLEVGAELPLGYEPPLRVLAELLGRTAPLQILDETEIALLARTARPQLYGPLERIIVQGQEGDSLFAVVDGTVEVLLRRASGEDVSLGMRHDCVLGEMSLLTGQPRSATVRALDGALVYEVGRRQLQPLLNARPELVDALQDAMAATLRTQASLLERYDGWASAFRRRFAKSFSA